MHTALCFPMDAIDNTREAGLDLSQLRVRQLLGRGGFANCWRASYNGRDIALKILSPRQNSVAANLASKDLEDDLLKRMFLREARITMQLDHRCIVRCYGVVQLPAGFAANQPAPAPAMSLELCEPYTLRDLITRSMAAGRRLFKLNQSYEWLIQVASALAYLHGQKHPIIHRDVKPENILLKREPGPTRGGHLVCKLSDFGLHVEVASNRTAMLRRSSKSTLKPSISGVSTTTGGGSPAASRPGSQVIGGQHQAAAAAGSVQALFPATQAGVEGAGGDAAESAGSGGRGEGQHPHPAAGGASHRPPRPQSSVHRLLEGGSGSPFLKISVGTSFTRTQRATSCTSRGASFGGESAVSMAKGRRVLIQEMPLQRSEAPELPASRPNGRLYSSLDENSPEPSPERNCVVGEGHGRHSTANGGSCGPAARPVFTPKPSHSPADIRPCGPLSIPTPPTDTEGAEGAPADVVAGFCHTPGTAVEDATIVLGTPRTIQGQMELGQDPPGRLPQPSQQPRGPGSGQLPAGPICPAERQQGEGGAAVADNTLLHSGSAAQRQESHCPPQTVAQKPAPGDMSTAATTSTASHAENEAAKASPAVNGVAKDDREGGGAARPSDEGAPWMMSAAVLAAGSSQAAVAVTSEEAGGAEDAGGAAINPFATAVAAAAAAAVAETPVRNGMQPRGQDGVQPQAAKGAKRGSGGDQKGDSYGSHASNHVGTDDRSAAASPTAAKSPTSPSATLSALLVRHPDLVEPVCDRNPAVGLRNVSSLMRQLGISELKQLRRNEMEWVFGLTGMAGSFMYMAPEVFRKEPYNEKSDVFSFGVLLYELVACELLVVSIFNTGRAAKLGVREPQDFAALVACGYRPPRIQKLPDATWALIEACWHQDPVQRPSMGDVVSELERLADEHRLEVTRKSRGGRTASSAAVGASVGPSGDAGGGRAATGGAPAASQFSGKAAPRVRVDGGGAAVGCVQCVVS